MRLFLCVLMGMLFCANAWADCPAAPAQGADDMVLRLKADTDLRAGILSAGNVSEADKRKAGTVIYDSSRNGIILCDGTHWVSFMSGTAGDVGQIQFRGNAGALAANAALVWDDVNGRLGIGNAAPTKSLTLGTGTSGSVTDVVELEIQSRGHAGLALRGDYTNADSEPGSAYVVMSIDGIDAVDRNTRVEGVLGMVQQHSVGNILGEIVDVTGNSLVLANLYTGTGGSPGHLHLATSNSVRMSILRTGEVGVGTVSPQATLDVNGYARLKMNTAQPSVCNAARQGSIALTSLAGMCVCTSANQWRFVNTETICTW